MRLVHTCDGVPVVLPVSLKGRHGRLRGQPTVGSVIFPDLHTLEH